MLFIAIATRFRSSICALSIILLAFAPNTARAAQGAIEGYSNHSEFARQVEALAKPGIAEISSLGTTLGGRKILAITIGTGKTAEKPAILVVGNVHAPQLVGSELAVRMARLLIERSAADRELKDLLDRFTFYIIPRPSPDASEAFFQKPFREREGNLRKTADERDPDAGRGDEAEDLNGDGWITTMRVADPTGRYMPHPDDPRVLIEADPLKNEHGAYDLYVEGRHDDDEADRPARSDGVAFNRNFPFRYPYFKLGAGPNAVSEVETRAVADFAFDHHNIAIVFCFSPEDNLTHLWKPDDNEGKVKTHIQRGDLAEYEFIAEKYRKLHGGSDAPPSPHGEGSFSEWAYFQYGRWSFAARGWWIPQVAATAAKSGEEKAADAKKGDEKKPEEPRGADLVNALRWFEQQKIDGFESWTAIKHPDFPNQAVEVGGFKPFLLLNPPAKQLDPLAEKHTDLLIELARLMPRIKIHEAKVEPLGDGIQRITVSVANTGYLPTASEMGRITGEIWPLLLKLEGPKGSTYLKGTPQKELDRLRGGEKTEWVWLIRTPNGKPGKAKITVSAPAVGSDSTTVELK
ncbi:MAG TPA: M14 family metallopeptidase [Pirellulales bacterium]|nr:M14 family metallopeptidase [Pirellulales bacterium]